MELCRSFDICERQDVLSPEPIVHLNVAELVIAEEPVVISTVLGSCVSVCLYCPTKTIGGMNHFALPSERYARTRRDLFGRELSDAMNFGSTSIAVLVEELCRLTREPCASIKAKIVGGASVVEALKQSSEIGALNIAVARKVLREYGIQIVGEDVGGVFGRKVHFHTDTGRLRVASLNERGIGRNEEKQDGDSVKGALSRAEERRRAPASSVVSLPSRRKRVLIVDDSKTIRTLLAEILGRDPLLEVVGAASDAAEAETMIYRLRPDVMTLDVHMPGVDGVTFLEKLLPHRPLPVVMITSLNINESASVIRALELGAIDYIQKPTFAEISLIGPMICEKVRAAADARIRILPAAASKERYRSTGARIDNSTVIAIGASTGGTEALKDVLVRLPQDIPPIVVVQHIPAVFSAAFAAHLNELCAFEVKEAENGDLLKAGRVLIAPGGRQMRIVGKAPDLQIEINDSPPVNRHSPSVDYLFESVAACIGKNAIGVILTGMGDDGARGLLKMRTAGAHTIAQGEASCVVFGMPREAIRLGAAVQVSDLDDIPRHLMNRKVCKRTG